MSSRPKGFGKTAGEYHRPRRPSTDTIRYLRSLPLDLNASLDEIRNFLRAFKSKDSSVEYPTSLAAALSAIDEICNEVASLAGDEHASEALELLIRITAPFSAIVARKLMTACSSYTVFLSTHRYGSHVLQTILQLSVVAETTDDLALHAEAPVLGGIDELPSLSEALLILHAELLPHAHDLATHVCGSHILRTLCFVLGGFQQRIDQKQKHQGSRRGGKSKAKQPDKVSTAVNDLRLVPISHSRLDQSDSNITQALQELTAAISGSEVQAPGALQQLACDSSASPLLIVLLRVLTYRDAVGTNKILEVNEEDIGPNPDHHLVLIPPEPHFTQGSAAEALAHRLLCWRSNKEASEQPYTGDVIYGLSGEPRGSHILDSLFRLSPYSFYESIVTTGDFFSPKTLCEYMEHDVSNFVVQTLLATIRTEEQAAKITSVLQENTLIILDAQKRRRGILWRWAELSVRFPSCQSKFIGGVSSALEKLQSNSKLSKHCAAILLGMKDSPDSDRLLLNVEGTRALYHMLRFEHRAAKSVVESVLALSSADLERLAKDGLGSRCVWDAILEQESSSMSPVRKKLLVKLKSRWVALATDRIGHHVVQKLFLALPDNASRETLVEELSQGKGRLEGNAMGRKIAALCKVREYSTKGKQEWEKVVGKTIKEKEWLEDMLQTEPHTSSDRKRKTSKTGAKPAGAQETSKRIKEMTMSDIMYAISMGKQKKK